MSGVQPELVTGAGLEESSRATGVARGSVCGDKIYIFVTLYLDGHLALAHRSSVGIASSLPLGQS